MFCFSGNWKHFHLKMVTHVHSIVIAVEKKMVWLSKIVQNLLTVLVTDATKRFSSAWRVPCSFNIILHHHGLTDGTSGSLELRVNRENLTSTSHSTIRDVLGDLKQSTVNTRSYKTMRQQVSKGLTSNNNGHQSIGLNDLQIMINHQQSHNGPFWILF